MQRRLLLLVLGGALAGCGPVLRSPEEQLVDEVFAAIRTGDRQAFEKLCITTADFMMRRAGIPLHQQRQSYLGTSIKPAEQGKQLEQFERAVAGGPGQIDFHHSEFVAVRELEPEETSLLTGGKLATRVFAAKVKKGKVVDDSRPTPYFELVKWGDNWRLLGLRF